MRYYETLYLINPDLAEDTYRDVVDKFNNVIEENNGVTIKVDEWGKKTLAYDIKKFDKGYYVLLRYCGEPDLLAELRRYFKLDDRVLKYQTIKLSNNVDPEALKAKTEELKAESDEEAKPAEEMGQEDNGEIVNNREDENGVY